MSACVCPNCGAVFAPEKWPRRIVSSAGLVLCDPVLLEMYVDDLLLSVRSANGLKNARIRSVRDLVQMTRKEMLEIKNFGRKSLDEVEGILREMGLGFGMRIG